MDNNQSIFRKQSLDRISSPEELNDYIRVTSPGVWFVLASVIILLLGVAVWGIFGRLDTTVTVAAIAKDGNVTAYILESDRQKVKEGMLVDINGVEGILESIDTAPVNASELLSQQLMHVGGIQDGDWVHPVLIKADIDDGVYSADIVIERIKPISFVVG